MQFLESALRQLPEVAKSPLAFVAYVVTIAAWVFIASKVQRQKILLSRLEAVPARDRAAVIHNEMGTAVPSNISAEQWIRARIHQYYFSGFVLLCFLFLAIFSL